MLLAMPEYKQCNSISIFMSMPKREIQTKEILEHSLQAGKHVYVPYIYNAPSPDGARNPVMDMLQLRGADDIHSLQPDRWGIPSLQSEDVRDRNNSFGGSGLTWERKDDAGLDKLDLILMPAVAFDNAFSRLGHGKGYYDSFLARSSSGGGRQALKRPFLGMLNLKPRMQNRQLIVCSRSVSRSSDASGSRKATYRAVGSAC